MRKRRKRLAGPQPSKSWVAEPYQRGQVYYDPTIDPGPLRMALIWFKAKHPNISCLFSGLFFLGVIAGYIWLIVFAFLQSDGKANWWLFLGIGLIFVPFFALILLPLHAPLSSLFSKPSLPLGPLQPKRRKRRKRSRDNEEPPTLFDPDDPAGFAQGLPKQKVRGLPKLRKPRSKGQKRSEKQTSAPSDQTGLDVPDGVTQ